MSKSKTPFFSIGARGTVANAITTQKRGRLTMVRKKPIPTDPKSAAQLAHRQKYQEAVAKWNALTPEEKDAWRGVCPGLPPYPCFMRSELLKVAPPPIIDIGAEAIDRATYTSPGRTYLLLDNPANATGEIDTIEIWAMTNLVGCWVGTFHLISGDKYRCRDAVDLGDVASGSKQTFPGLSLNVEAGDFIGFYVVGGNFERDSFGFAGLYWVTGWYCRPEFVAEYTLLPGDTASLYGTGQPAP